MSCISRTVITEPFNLFGELIYKTETACDSLCHEIFSHFPGYAPCGGSIAQDLPVAAIHAEGNPNSLPVPADDLKSIGTPPCVASINHHFSIMRSSRSSSMSLKQETVDLHDPVNPLMVDSGLTQEKEISVQDRRYPSVSVCRPLLYNLSDNGKMTIIFNFPI